MDNYKRLEIYVWWTCNQKCLYCIEFPNMEKMWNIKVSISEILAKLLKYKKKWYNHVTFLWGEPFIQPVFYSALKLAKSFWYTILVTTNATTLNIEKQAQKFLPYIDELVLSVEAIDKELQQKISNTNVFVKWENVFKNINKYWKWKLLKANIVLVKDNFTKIYDIINFLYEKWVKEIAITYPDLNPWYYWIDKIKSFLVSYNQAFFYIERAIDDFSKKGIILKIVDFPFCIFPEKNRDDYIKLTDDFSYQTRVKISHKWETINRWDLKNNLLLPRKRIYSKKCLWCFYYKNICWWHELFYEEIFWLNEINAITN